MISEATMYWAKKLQATTLRIEKMLQEIENKEEQVTSKKLSIPRDFSVCYLCTDQ